MSLFFSRIQRLALFASLPLLLITSSAFAANDTRGVVMPFTGPGAAAVRSAVAREVSKRGVKLVPPTAAQKALRKERLSLGKSEDRAALADSLEVGAIVTGAVRKVRGYEATVTIYGDDGQALGVVKWRGKNPKLLARKMPAKAKKQLARLIKRIPSEPSFSPDASMALAEADETEEEEDDAPFGDSSAASERASSASTSSATASRSASDVDEGSSAYAGSVSRRADAPSDTADSSRPLLRVQAGPRVLSRSFSYGDSLPAGSRSFRYNLLAVPMVAVVAESFPLRSMGGVLGSIGVRGAFSNAMGLGTTTRDGGRYDGTAREILVGIQSHARMGPATIGGRVQGGQQTFSLGIVQNRYEDGPDVAYTFVEPQLTVGVDLGSRLSITGAAGFRFIQSAGELSSSVYLQRARMGAVDGEVGVTFRVTDSVDVQLAGSLQRYFASVDPEEGAALSSGSAVDIHRQVGLGVAFRL